MRPGTLASGCLTILIGAGAAFSGLSAASAQELGRPLFAPTRRAVAIAMPSPAALPVTGSGLPDLTLLGTIISGNSRFAVVSPRPGEAVKLRIGEAYGGWELARIDRRSAGFRRGEAIIELSLPEPGVVAPRPVAPTEAAGTGGDPKRRLFNATAIPMEQRSEPFDPSTLD